MFELFYMGGSLFMGMLTLLLLIVITLAIRNRIKFTSGDWDISTTRRNLTYVKSTGILAFVMGVLGQLIGLYSAFIQIEKVEEISHAILANGLKVSMITTLYGLIIFILSLLIWLIMDSMLNEDKKQ